MTQNQVHKPDFSTEARNRLLNDERGFDLSADGTVHFDSPVALRLNV